MHIMMQQTNCTENGGKLSAKVNKVFISLCLWNRKNKNLTNRLVSLYSANDFRYFSRQNRQIRHQLCEGFGTTPSDMLVTSVILSTRRSTWHTAAISVHRDYKLIPEVKQRQKSTKTGHTGRLHLLAFSLLYFLGVLHFWSPFLIIY